MLKFSSTKYANWTDTDWKTKRSKNYVIRVKRKKTAELIATKSVWTNKVLIILRILDKLNTEYDLVGLHIVGKLFSKVEHIELWALSVYFKVFIAKKLHSNRTYIHIKEVSSLLLLTALVV